MRIGIVLIPLALYGQVAQQLISSDPGSRQTALQQLAALPAEQRSRYISELVPLLRGKEANRVVHALAKIGPSAVPALLNLLDDPDPGVRAFAAKAIATIRPVAPQNAGKPHLMLKDNDQWVRRRVAESLMSIGFTDDQAQSILREQWPPDGSPLGPKPSGTFTDWIQLLSSDDVVVAADAVYFLKSAGASAVPDLIAALKNQNPKIRWGAAEALQRMHLFRSDIEAACIQALQDPSAQVRDFARSVLIYQVSEAAMDAVLQDEIAEIARKGTFEERAQAEKTRPHTRAEILAPIPSDADYNYPLEVSNQIEMTSPDGTRLLTVLHTGKERGDWLRVWRFRQGSYHLVKEEETAEPGSHLSAGGFRFKGKEYLHVRLLWDGTGYQHQDEFFRIEASDLVKLEIPKGLPLVLAPGEGVWKGFFENFKDDDLEFQFGIWKEGDANCCPTAGWVKGTYTIVGDELKVATWNRSMDIPR